MSFSYADFKRKLANKYSDKLSKEVIEELLSFEPSLLDNKFPQKKLILEHIEFRGVKNTNEGEKEFTFNQSLNEGIYILIADNLKGKSSVFKIIKFILTGDNDIAVDIKSWLKEIYLEFRINDTFYTSYLNLEKHAARGSLFKTKLDQILDKANDVDPNWIIFNSDSAASYKESIQDFFFNEFQFYHLNWTQKASQKDKNELIEAKASWNTYYESIYLTSRASNTLAFGNQEELIFQMLLGLKLTYPINRIKVKLEKTTFDLSKLREYSTREIRSREAELNKVKNEYDRTGQKLDKLKQVAETEIDLFQLYEDRNEYTNQLDTNNHEQVKVDSEILEIKHNVSQLTAQNREITSDGKHYNDLIKKAKKSKIALEEHIQFGIFFSNLDIKICPHCNTSVTDEKRKKEKETKECMLCSHTSIDVQQINSDSFELKVDSLQLEIDGYEKQVKILRGDYQKNTQLIIDLKNQIKEKEKISKELKAKNRENSKELKDLDKAINDAKKQSGNEKEIVELEKQQAVLEYRLKKLEEDSEEIVTGEVIDYEYRIDLLEEALEILKANRTTQNEEIINNFKTLLLEELHDLGITAVSEVSLTNAYKISYNINGNWVTFDKISEGEQLRIKIAFYLSIIQLDIKYNSGKHPRLLIIDSPAKEEADKIFIDGLKKLLSSISEKYKNDLQILIGTASRELENALPSTNIINYPEGEFVF